MSEFREIVQILLKRDLKARYTGSMMGFFWSVINPLIYIVVFAVVFGGLLGIRFPGKNDAGGFLDYMLAGILPWFMVQETVLRCTTAFTDNRELVKTVRFPLTALPVALVLSSLVNHLAALTVFTLFLGVAGDLPTPLPGSNTAAFYISRLALLLILPLFLSSLAAGLGLAAAVVHNFFRDMSHLVGALLIIWMYATPVFYPESMIVNSSSIPDIVKYILGLNPLASIIGGYRSVFIGDPVAIPSITYGFAASLAALGFGILLFRAYRNRFPELL